MDTSERAAISVGLTCGRGPWGNDNMVKRRRMCMDRRLFALVLLRSRGVIGLCEGTHRTSSRSRLDALPSSPVSRPSPPGDSVYSEVNTCPTSTARALNSRRRDMISMIIALTAQPTSAFSDDAFGESPQGISRAVRTSVSVRVSPAPRAGA